MATINLMREDGTQRKGLIDLCVLVKRYLGDNNLKMVEVGSYCGESGGIIASNFPNSILNCVDPWQKYTEEGSTYDLDEQELVLKEAERIFDSTILKYPNMRKNKMSSKQYSELLENESIDFIYIDGNHQYSSIKEDLEIWSKKIRTGGIIAGHDYNWVPVNKAVNEFFKISPVDVFCDNSWFHFKN